MANQGSEGVDRVVVNKNGQILTTFTEPVQFLNNNYSETQAALHRIILCCQPNF